MSTCCTSYQLSRFPLLVIEIIIAKGNLYSSIGRRINEINKRRLERVCAWVYPITIPDVEDNSNRTLVIIYLTRRVIPSVTSGSLSLADTISLLNGFPNIAADRYSALHLN